MKAGLQQRARITSMRAGLVALLIGLASCADTSSTAPQVPAKDAVPVPLADAESPAEGYAVAGALPQAQYAATLAAFNGALKAVLGAPSASWRLQPERDRPTRVVLDADRAFEAGSSQLRPELLLPLSAIAAATRGGGNAPGSSGAWVVHVIGHAERSEDAGLAERRALAIASYLAGQDLPGGRLRAETRSDRSGDGHRIELVFAAIVEGRELRAWMPPGAVAAGR